MPWLSNFLQKRWVRIVGLVPMVGYTWLAISFAKRVIATTILRPPNLVFAGTDMVGMIGYLVFLTVVACSGIAAILTAYFMKGIYRLLYISGTLAALFALLFLPLSITFNAPVEFNPLIPNDGFLAGKWVDKYYRLSLNADHTYSLEHREESGWKELVSVDVGHWQRERNDLHMTNLPFCSDNPWQVYASDGHYFITYCVPGNFDAWSGNLGLMRESEWPGSK